MLSQDSLSEPLNAEERTKLWQAMLQDIQGLSNLEKLNKIHDFNRLHIQWISDPDQWQLRDFWEWPEKVLETGMADCDGKAIFAYVGIKLANIDWPVKLARISRRNRPHLVVFCGEYVVDSDSRSLYFQNSAIPLHFTFDKQSLWVQKPGEDVIQVEAQTYLGEWQRAIQQSNMLKAIA